MNPDEPSKPRRRKGRALLIAVAGVASIQLTHCASSVDTRDVMEEQPVGNLSVSVPPDAADVQHDVRPDVMEEQPVGNLDVSVPPRDASDAAVDPDASDGSR